MYSEKTLKLLSSSGIDVLDTISVNYEGAEVSGILMPHSSGSDNVLVIKLASGYNIGISVEKLKSVSLVQKALKQPHSHAGSGSACSPEGCVSILGCGGTIASKVEYKTGAAFPSFTPEELVADFPELSELGKLSGRLLFSLLSEDMQVAHWQAIAEEVSKEIRAGAEGVVLTHGTDTLGYTSSALSFMLQDLPVPVVLVGAQRSSDRGSSDNKLNLLSSVLAARSELAEVMVCMHNSLHDDVCALHRGTRVRKMHTSRRDAFKSINSEPIGFVDYSKRAVIFSSADVKKRGPSTLKSDTRMNDNVALLYTHPGIKKKLFSALSSYDGVVIAGTGLGHVPMNPFNDKFGVSLFSEIKSLVDSGIPVVMAPQTLFGRINLNVYSAGRMLLETGVIGNLCDWTPETALVKLMWVLGHTKDMQKIRAEMQTSIAGEISARSEVSGQFL